MHIGNLRTRTHTTKIIVTVKQKETHNTNLTKAQIFETQHDACDEWDRRIGETRENVT